MASDNFLQIAGIKGESTDDKHKDWIEILSYSWGVSQLASATQSSAGGGTTQRADFRDFSISKLADIATPLLFKFCAQGNHIDEIKFELCRSAGDQKLVYMTYTFKNVVISSLVISGGDAGEPVENVTFNYGEVKVNYVKQARKGGGGSGNMEAGWNLETNKPV